MKGTWKITVDGAEFARGAGLSISPSLARTGGSYAAAQVHADVQQARCEQGIRCTLREVQSRVNHEAGCSVARRAREAPLVALVNTVPAGLDPIGWRAAVLAVVEVCGLVSLHMMCFRVEDEEEGTANAVEGLSIERQIRVGQVRSLAGKHALPAYRRAVSTRGVRVPPHRTASPALPLDVDHDLAGLAAAVR